jgi:uncharacterized membrane protein YphA (DoxX/SURF4 family)
MKTNIASILQGTSATGSRAYELCYALFRFYCGISIALGAGLSKVFHKVDENGPIEWSNLAFGAPEWFIKQVADIGFTFISPSFWAYVAIYGEFIGGLLIAFGFLTRISAMQMAFQFFVVSFIWYDSPIPFTMYYQQLIFWSFVMIAAVGSGRYSIDQALANRQAKLRGLGKKLAIVGAVMVFPLGLEAQDQTDASLRVSFTISNPSLRVRNIEVRHFNYENKKSSGYGYDLGPLNSHPVNMPVGTRVYEKQGKDLDLIYVIEAKDQGLKINLNKKYEITQQQWLDNAWAQRNTMIYQLEELDKNPDLAALAQKNGVDMVTFIVSGKSTLGKMTHIRVEPPFKSDNSLGFSKTLSRSSRFQVTYPVGSKIYLCEGPFWEKEYPEQLLFTLEAEQSSYLIRL